MDEKSQSRQMRWRKTYSLTLPLAGWIVALVLLFFLVLFAVAGGRLPV